jgi:periplasmic protein TonB
MTPLKDTLEATAPTTETVVASPVERKADAGQLRADAVSLDVPVKIHGSRVTEVVREITQHTEPFEEQTATLIVFPQGGVVRMSTAVTVGQVVVLTNLKSGHDAICRVVKVRACPPTQSYVEIEFTHRQPGYWGVHFASDEPLVSQQPAPLAAPTVTYIAPPVSVQIKIEKTGEKKPAPALVPQMSPAKSSDASVFANEPKVPAASSAQNTPAGKPASPFVSIGAQEEVQPAASSTTLRRDDRFGSDRPRSSGDSPLRLPADFPPAPPTTSDASFSMPDSMAALRGDTHATPSISFPGAGVPGEGVEEINTKADSSSENTSSTFGRFAASANLGGARAAHREPFGSGLTSGGLRIDEHSGELQSSESKSKGSNWVAITAGMAALVLVVAAAAFYFHMGPFAKNSTSNVATQFATNASSTQAVAPPASVVDPSASTGHNPASSTAAQGNRAPQPAAVAAPITAQAAQTPPARAVRGSSTPPPQPANAARQKSAVPGMFVALNAHPVSSQRGAESEEANAAPSVDARAAGSENNSLEGISSSSVPQPLAPPAPIRMGGQVKPPRLIYSILPVYPAVARNAAIEGDVVVDTSLDKTGRVAAMKVISGPAMLRQAALDALRQWKYEPSLLNGDPIAVQTVVTIRFHR